MKELIKQKDTIREEFEELTKEPIGRDEAGNEYSIWDVVYNHDKDQTEVGVMITDWWLQKLEEAYQQGAKDKVEEVDNILKKELSTWAKESIGAKAVESVQRAISDKSLKDNT